MGYGIRPYVVPMAKLRASCGSKSRELIAVVERECRELIVEIDGAFESQIAGGTPDAATAVAQLVDGSFGASRSGAFMYVYALEILCAQLGARLDAPVLERTSTALLELIDRVLRARGVDAFGMRDLTSGRSPVKLPPRTPLPGIGTLEPSVIAIASKQMARLDLSESEVPHDDRGMRAAAYRAIGEVREWVEAARAMRGAGLLCFYY
jgi:hypothetical protein